jgi:2Fe-2S ferredoxin
MVRIVYVDHAGEQREVNAELGATLMLAAVRNGVVAIEGECGGACACATCHIYVPEAWRGVTGSASENEREMLECANDADDRSRLGCQVVVTAEMDGMTVFTPRSQR